MRVKYTKDLLEPIISRSINWASVCRELGVKPATGAQTHVKKRAVDFGIDFTHFLGSASNRCRQFKNKNINFYLENNTQISSHRLKKLLIRDGIKESLCEICRASQWLGEEIVLELDHINNDHFDNTLSNLMILCPNCHAQKTRKARMAKK